MAGKDQSRKSVASYLNLGSNPVAQLNSLVTKAKEIPEEEIQLLSFGECTSINSITSEDDFIIIDEDDVDIDLPVAYSRQGNTEPSSTSTGNVAASSQAGGSSSTKHPLPLTPIQQRFLQDRLSARRTVLQKLEQNGHKATFDFDHGEVNIETQGSGGADNALSILKNSVMEVKIDFTEDELQKMASATDIADGDPVLPLSMLSSDQEILVVIDRSEGNMKMVGLADAIDEVKEKLKKSQELLNPAQASSSVVSQGSNTNQSRQTDQVPHNSNINEDSQPNSGAKQQQQREPITTVVPVRESKQEYLMEHKADDIHALITDTNGLFINMTGEDGIEVSGPPDAVNAAVAVIKVIAGQVKSDTFSFADGVNMASFTEATVNAGKKNNVMIAYKQNTATTRAEIRVRSQALPHGGPSERPPTTSVRQEAKVSVVLKRLETHKADVVVNTTNAKVNLNEGLGVSNSILKAAGETIQQELRHVKPHGIEHGKLAVSGSGKLTTCKTIYHVALPYYRGGGGETMELSICYEYLVSAVFQSLTRASTEGYQTIALPAFGTGALEYPVKNVVQLMFKAIDRFNQDQRARSIKEIFIVISPETRSEVKQLFLAHQLTHYMKTRHLKYPDQREGLFKKLLSPSSAAPNYFQTEVAKTHQPKCEVRAKIGDTLLQVIHGDIRKVCDVIDTVMVPWIGEEISTPNDQPGLRCTDPDRKQWSCRIYVTELPKSKCAADSTTSAGKTLIHTYSTDATERCMSVALQKGLEKAGKEKSSMVTIPIPPESTMAASPSHSASAIVSAIDGSRSGVDVVTVVIPNDNIFVDFVNKLAGMKRLEEPADISMTKFVDTLWSVTHANQAVRSLTRAAAFNTGVDARMVVTSVSTQKNRAAAQEVATELNVELMDVISSRSVARPT